MTLSCSCGEYDGEGGGWGYYIPEDFTVLETTKRKRCQSCKTLIDKKATVLKFDRMRGPSHEVEINIYGEDGEISLAPWYMCEKCGEIYLNLTAAGYCLNIEENMKDDLKEYQAMTGFVPEKCEDGSISCERAL